MTSAQQYVPYAFARDNLILLKPTGDREAEVWITEATGVAALQEVMRAFPGRVRANVVDARVLTEAIAQTYSRPEDSAQQIVGDIEGEIDITRMMQDVPDIEDLLETEDDAPIIRMINALLTHAARDGASDIHLEAFEQHSLVRFRVDGTLRDVVRPKRALHAALVSRIKIMAAMDIAEKRLPQDGRITLRVGGRAIDVRVSTLPTGHGERVVLRLLEKDMTRIDLTNLGMSDRTLAIFDQMFHQPHGIVLVTGPTGSGKSTTLYAAIRRLDHDTSNIMTVEDPIEYDLPGVGQTQVNPKIDMSFARALRSILRQDPDVDHDRRDPRPGNRADRGAGFADRPPRAGDAAHQRRGDRGHADDRHGHRAVPALVLAAGRAGAAPGAQALSALPQARPIGARFSPGRAASTAVTPATAVAPGSTNCCRSTTPSAG